MFCRPRNFDDDFSVQVDLTQTAQVTLPSVLLNIFREEEFVIFFSI